MNKQELNEALGALLEDIKNHTAELREPDVRIWLASAAIRIWASNAMFSEDYISALSLLTGQVHTTAQIMTAMSCAGEQAREIVVPDFFREIVKKDVESANGTSRTIADSLCRFLAMLALVNGDFTLAEANVLRAISDSLVEYCDHEGVIPGTKRQIHREMITPLKKDSYYQASLAQKEKATTGESVNPLPSTQPAKRAEEPAAPVITLNFNVVSEPVNPELSDQRSAEQSSKANEGVTIKKPSQKETVEDETLESVLAELHGLVGLDKVKNDVQSLLNFIRICQMRTQRGMKVPNISYHLVFTGNPGTGKTTVARMVAKLYYLMGILPQGQLVETDRSGLVAGYLGQTAIKTQKVIQQALGGVLFIDEAYALANDKEDSYGKEAIETILKAMEDHRDELVVIVAGYDELMHRFIDSNPGLRSRFNKYFHFPDYDGKDLLAILKRFCDTNGYTLAEDAIPHLQTKLNDMYENRKEHFGNARSVRNLFEHAINHQANRLVLDNDLTDRELAELTLDDILPAMEGM